MPKPRNAWPDGRAERLLERVDEMVRAKPVMYRRVRVDEIESGRRPGVIGYVMLVVIVPVFLLGLAFVKLNSDQVKLRRQLTEMRRDYGLRSKEQANLELEVEMYRNSARIFSQVQRLGLGLQMPTLGQVTRIRSGAPVAARRAGEPLAVVER